MKRILFSLGLFLALVGSHAYAEIFYAEPVNGTYSDCTKAIEKGVAILVDPEATTFITRIDCIRSSQRPLQWNVGSQNFKSDPTKRSGCTKLHTL